MLDRRRSYEPRRTCLQDWRSFWQSLGAKPWNGFLMLWHGQVSSFKIMCPPMSLREDNSLAGQSQNVIVRVVCRSLWGEPAPTRYRHRQNLIDLSCQWYLARLSWQNFAGIGYHEMQDESLTFDHHWMPHRIVVEGWAVCLQTCALLFLSTKVGDNTCSDDEEMAREEKEQASDVDGDPGDGISCALQKEYFAKLKVTNSSLLHPSGADRSQVADSTFNLHISNQGGVLPHSHAATLNTLLFGAKRWILIDPLDYGENEDALKVVWILSTATAATKAVVRPGILWDTRLLLGDGCIWCSR